MQTVEEMIAERGANKAPRITPVDIEANIVAEQIIHPEGTLLTLCVLTLRNGFTVVGQSACVSPENFDAEIGTRVARDNAKQQIWPLMGYALASIVKASQA